MLATQIPDYERRFFQTRTDAQAKRFQLVPASVAIPGDVQPLQYLKCTRDNGDTSFFYEHEVAKDRIALHFTAGYLAGDVANLTKPGYFVSVPFIIARDGTILNMWPSKFWSYHLGPEAVGGNPLMSQSSVAIEVSNIGPLTLKGNRLLTCYSTKDKDDVYCTVDQTQFYQKLDTPYRGYSYYATFTPEQYDSLTRLLRFLTARYRIPRAFLPENERYLTLSADRLRNFRGITSHVNYRPSGKYDIGPAFDWPRVISGLTA